VEDVIKFINETEYLDKHAFEISAMLEGILTEEQSEKIIELSGKNDKASIIKIISQL
jgi:hypothetical protein